jgi:hypothetical protein
MEIHTPIAGDCILNISHPSEHGIAKLATGPPPCTTSVSVIVISGFPRFPADCWAVL